MSAIPPRLKNLVGGILMLGLGVAAIVGGRTYELGTVTRMGPGFFPTVLGCILALTGLAIAAAAPMSAGSNRAPSVAPEWRGWICIILGVVAFVVLARSTGLLPATFAIVFISALGDRQNTLRGALGLAAGIVVVSLVVFWWALKIQLPLFAWSWP